MSQNTPSHFLSGLKKCGLRLLHVLKTVGKMLWRVVKAILFNGSKLNIVNTVILLSIVAALCFTINVNRTFRQTQLAANQSISDRIETGYATIDLRTSISSALDIGELSTAKLVYNGIVRVYDEKKPDKERYAICYNSTVKIGIDLTELSFSIDDNDKVVYFFLPKLKLHSVDIDTSAIDYIPADPHLDMNTVITTCKNDVLAKAEASDILKQSAGTNLKSVIEALVRPILDDAGYQIMWRADGTEAAQ